MSADRTKAIDYLGTAYDQLKMVQKGASANDLMVIQITVAMAQVYATLATVMTP